MRTADWRWFAAPLIATLSLGVPASAAGQGDDKKGKKGEAREEDSDVPTPGQLPPPPSPPRQGTPAVPSPKRQAPFPAQPGARLVVAPGAHYAASGLHGMLMGQNYRAAWTTPVEVPVLDLGRFAGGLKPTKKGGGKQTLSLQFVSADGRRYKFRTIDKDPAPSLQPHLRDTLAESVVHDATSAAHPGALLVADGLSAAAGLLHVKHEMVVMPDDDSLGEFRAEFAGQLGTLEQVADEEHRMPPGFDGITKVIESDTLIERIENDPEQRVDARSYLKGRLFDIFLGDWDRHMEQWEWVRGGDGEPWRAYATDRDFAFVSFEGLLPGVMAAEHPMLVKFRPLYPNVLGLAWNSRVLDRRLLSGLERPVYLEVARKLMQSLTDEAIADAVRRLPRPWFALDGERFITTLKSRRDRLPQAAEEFYALMSREVELHGTNAVETVQIRRDEGNGLEVVMTNEGGSEPLLRRRFKDGETSELRLYLKGGDDKVTTIGTTGDGIDVRVAGGPGDDVLDDSQGGGTGLYDHEGDNRIEPGDGTFENTNYWVQPVDHRGYPLRDWGGSQGFRPWISAGADLGLLMGMQWQHKDYGFRRLPWASRQTVRAGYSTGRAGWKAEYVGDFMHTASHRQHQLRAMLSDIELVRFYGFGNETPGGRDSEFFRAEQRQYLVSPSYRWGSRTVGIRLGAIGKFSDSKLVPGTFLEATRPYGVENFGQVGPQLTFLVDTRDSEVAARRGVVLLASGTYYPKVWSVDAQFGVTNAEVSTYLSPGPFTLALRAGGKKVFGDLVPFHEAAYIGGPGTVRGLRRNRYAGNASAFGTAELRLRLGRIHLLVPLGVGIFGFGDMGRVFVEGQTSDVWHTGVGGGLSFAIMDTANTFSVSMAWPGSFRDGRFRRSFDDDNRPRFYLNGGFTF